jgi:hypothetical protein
MTYPTMSFRTFILKYARETEKGKFYCVLCSAWINKQRWIHFKKHHRFRSGKNEARYAAA